MACVVPTPEPKVSSGGDYVSILRRIHDGVGAVDVLELSVSLLAALTALCYESEIREVGHACCDAVVAAFLSIKTGFKRHCFSILICLAFHWTTSAKPLHRRKATQQSVSDRITMKWTLGRHWGPDIKLVVCKHVESLTENHFDLLL